jgi:hypothetical protein
LTNKVKSAIVNQNQFDSYSSETEAISNATPAKTLSDPKEVSKNLFKGKDGMDVDYSFKIHPMQVNEKGKNYCIAVFTGHQTRIEMLFYDGTSKEGVKNRLARLGYFFKKIS